MVLSELLKEIVTSLENKGLPYMVSGSLAMTAYTVPRMTRDIDIVIDIGIEDLESFLPLFERNFYINPITVNEEIRRRGMFNVIDHRSGYKIDFVVKKNSSYRRLEFERRNRSEILGVAAWLVSAEDLVISKLIWIQDIQSEKQMEDIRNLMENLSLDTLYIQKWIKELNLKTFDIL
jgi:hypothetical protein